MQRIMSFAITIVMMVLASAQIYGQSPLIQPPTYPTRKPGNVSLRAEVHSGGNEMIAGFVTHTPGAQQYLVRAIGPSLKGFGIKKPNPHVIITLYDMSTGKVIASSDGWEPQLANVFNQVGAFQITNGAGDSAILVNLPSGRYTAVVTSPVDGGIGLGEIYQVDTKKMVGGLVNASLRGIVSDGEGQLIAGITMVGDGGCQILFRAVGPSLAQFGVPNTVPDPKMTLYEQVAVTTNKITEYCENKFLPSFYDPFGAFPIAYMSGDAVIVFNEDLISWNGVKYTAPVSSPSGTKGNVIEEIYLLQTH